MNLHFIVPTPERRNDKPLILSLSGHCPYDTLGSSILEGVTNDYFSPFKNRADRRPGKPVC
jgi:hypothetical protein